MEAIKIDSSKGYKRINNTHPYVIEIYKDNEFIGYSNGDSDWDSNLNTIVPHIMFNNGDGYRVFSLKQMYDAINKLCRLYNDRGYVFKVLDYEWGTYYEYTVL